MTKKIQNTLLVKGVSTDIVDMQEVITGMKMTRKFVLNDFEAETSSGIKVSPDSMTFSLMGQTAHSIEIKDGALVSESEDVSSSSKLILFSSKNDALTNYTMVTEDLSLLSSKSIYRSLKRLLFSHMDLYAKGVHNADVKRNKDIIYAKKEGVNDVQIQPKKLEFNEDYKNAFIELGEEYYQKSNIFSISFKLAAPNIFEAYIDNDSEIVQYNSYAQIHATVSFINSNRKLISFTVSEFLDQIDSITLSTVISKIRAAIDSKIVRFSTFTDLPSGSYPIIMKPSASNVFFHEALAGHLLSGTYIAGGISPVFKDELYATINSLKGVNIIMDPTISGGFGSYPYDHEGVKTTSVTLIEDGKIMNYLTDRYAAARLEEIQKDKEVVSKIIEALPEEDTSYIDMFVGGEYSSLTRPFKSIKERIKFLLEERQLGELLKNLSIDQSLDWRNDHNRINQLSSNGHSRVEGWMGEDINGNTYVIQSEARMSNLIVKTDKDVDPVKELLSQISETHDFYLEIEAYNGYVNPENAAFVVKPEIVTMVSTKDGTRVNINPGEFSMNLRDFLPKIVAVGNNNEENRGFCGADSGYVPVGSYTPDIAVLDVPFVGGKEISYAEDYVFKIMASKEEL